MNSYLLYIAELPAILGSFYWLRQYHKHSYRGGGWGAGATKWRVKGTFELKTAK